LVLRLRGAAMEGKVQKIFIFLCLMTLMACQSEDDVKDLTLSFAACDGCFVCSGMELQQGVILTAAHCFEGEDVESIRRIELIEPQSRNVSVKRIEIHPSYSRTLAEHDVALIILQDAETSSFSPNVLFNSEVLTSGQKLYSVSFEPNGKRKVKEHEFTEKDFEHLFAKDIDPICKGNSGGPVYKVVDNTFFLVGVISGIDATISQLFGACNDGFESRFIDIREVSDWLVRALTPPSELLVRIQ
jgi:secreted trypsin-like serine protease